MRRADAAVVVDDNDHHHHHHHDYHDVDELSVSRCGPFPPVNTRSFAARAPPRFLVTSRTRGLLLLLFQSPFVDFVLLHVILGSPQSGGWLRLRSYFSRRAALSFAKERQRRKSRILGRTAVYARLARCVSASLNPRVSLRCAKGASREFALTNSYLRPRSRNSVCIALSAERGFYMKHSIVPPEDWSNRINDSVESNSSGSSRTANEFPPLFVVS